MIDDIKFDDNIIEMIKNDDISVVDYVTGPNNDYRLQRQMLSEIIEKDSFKCFKEFLKRFHFVEPMSFKPSRKMSRLLYDLFDFSQRSYNKSGNFFVFKNLKKISPNICLPMYRYSTLQKSIENNDIPKLKLLMEEQYTDECAFNQFNSIMSNVDYSKCDTDTILYLISRGYEINNHVIPSSMLKNNQIELINILRNQYGYLLDYSVLTEDDISSMVLNNSLEAIGLIIDAGIAKRFIELLLRKCAAYNCEELLDLLISKKDFLFIPKCGNNALKEACKLMRFPIAEKLLIPSILDKETIEEAMNIVKALKNDEFYMKLENILHELETPL